MIASDVSGVVIPIVKLMLQAKCQGKEHMIESEIAILSSVEHPHIIQLKEQQLWPLTRLPILQRKQNYQQIELNGRLVFIVTHLVLKEHTRYLKCTLVLKVTKQNSWISTETIIFFLFTFI